MMCPSCKKGILQDFLEGKRCLRCMVSFDHDGHYTTEYNAQVFKQPEGYKSNAVTLGPAHPEEPNHKPYQVSDTEYAKHSRLLAIKKKQKKYRIGNSWI